MRRWNATQLTNELTGLCLDMSGGPTWGSVAARIGRWIPWEFDYRYDEDTNAVVWSSDRADPFHEVAKAARTDSRTTSPSKS